MADMLTEQLHRAQRVLPSRVLAPLAAMAFALTLGACADKPTVQRLPELSFTNEPAINLDVAQMEIVSDFQPTGQPPHYEHLMPVSPEAAAIRWAKDRLHPVGRTGYARVVIKDAKVIKTDLRTDKSLGGMFKDEQAERYQATLEVTVQIQDERHMVLGDVTARATRLRSLAEDVTVNERERAMYDISDSMSHDIDRQMDGLIHTYLSRWVVLQ